MNIDLRTLTLEGNFSKKTLKSETGWLVSCSNLLKILGRVL